MMFLFDVFAAFICVLVLLIGWILAYYRIKNKGLDTEPLQANFKKWLSRCLVFALIMFLVDAFLIVLVWGGSTGHSEYGLNLRWFFFLVCGVSFNLIFLGLVGVVEFFKTWKK